MRAVRRPKVVLVTGASGGIGSAVAREAARRGHRLALTARRAELLDALADELSAAGAEAVAIPADLADPEAPGRIVEAVADRLGGLDVLVNNAGMGLPRLFAAADPEAIRRQVVVNLVAPLVLTRLALPLLLEGGGAVINVGSAITSVPNPALGAYGATKAGLAFWNDALRRELRHRGVAVCLVEPGPVATGFFRAMDDFTPAGAPVYNPLGDPPPDLLSADPDDVARRVVRLIDHPRRRLTVLRRVVWPFRLIGGLFRVAPGLGDVAVSSIVRHLERTAGLTAEGTAARARR